MAANAWTFHDDAVENEGETANMATDTFVMRLYTSASNINDATLSSPAAATNEIANANGYTTGGQTISNMTYTQPVAGIAQLTSDATVWNASGGPITARFAAVINTTTNLIYFSTVLDNTPADTTAQDGNAFTVTPGANGYYRKQVEVPAE